MVDIPSQLSFEHMLAHMFPGFFAALSLFMILDILSPFNLAQVVALDINALISFYGILLLGGTIFGVIIDGIHHRVIEQEYFRITEKDIGDKGIRPSDIWDYHTIDKNCPQGYVNTDNKICNICKFREKDIEDTTKIYFLFDIANLETCIVLRDYLRKSVYHYSEFYANTFIALIPFTFIAPIYLVKRLQIDFGMALVAGLILTVLTVACLDFAWMAYKRWISALYFAFCRCQEKKTEGQASNQQGA